MAPANIAKARLDSCEVSFAMACFNAMPYLDEAIESALAQSGVTLEVLIVDDGSSDGSDIRAMEWAAYDPRVRFFRTANNGGPGAARNVALEQMQGEWFAVLDSDDRILPHRSRVLIDEAEHSGADAIADDLLVFGLDLPPTRFLLHDDERKPFWMSLENYFADSAVYGGRPNPGFLKPMFRKTKLTRLGLAYNPLLRIAEDDELMVRVLLGGSRYRIVPAAMYEYRKHSASISHRLSGEHAQLMVNSEHRLKSQVIATGHASPAYWKRWRALLSAAAFSRSIDYLKSGELFNALRVLLGRPRAILLYAMPIKARLRRLRDRIIASGRS
ncbi:MAG: glycosyltransferase family 2 protein [Erythrobacter sp.]